MSVYGLYQPYKVNRPLTRSEKKYRLRQGQPLKVKNFNCDKSVVRINSTYLETVDKFYVKGGEDGSFFALAFIMFVSIYFYFLYHAFFLSSKDIKDIVINIVIISVATSPFYIFCGYFLLKEWFKWTHYPIRFNRKNKMVYVFRTDGTILTVPWKDIFFTQDEEPGALSGWTIRGHILAQDGETVLETFSLGVCEYKPFMPQYWEYIRCYMEEDVVGELAELVMLSPPVEDRKEGYIFGLQYLLCMESRLEWLFLPVTLPFYSIASLFRYITSQTGKIPRWPPEVEEACKPDADDPVNVCAASNPENMWQLVFANQPLRVWRKKYKRGEDATNRIHQALAERYGNDGRL